MLNRLTGERFKEKKFGLTVTSVLTLATFNVNAKHTSFNKGMRTERHGTCASLDHCGVLAWDN